MYNKKVMMISSFLTETTSKTTKATSLVSIIGNPVCNTNNEKNKKKKIGSPFLPDHLRNL